MNRTALMNAILENRQVTNREALKQALMFLTDTNLLGLCIQLEIDPETVSNNITSSTFNSVFDKPLEGK